METKGMKERYFTIVNKLGSVQRDATNPFAKARYASLSNIQKHLAPLLAAENSYLIFDFGEFADGVYVVKLRMCGTDTDETMNWTFAVPLDNKQGNAVQAFGSTTTYGQRYALCVAFQIALDDEDPDARKDQAPPPAHNKEVMKLGTKTYKDAVSYLAGGGTMAAIEKKYVLLESVKQKLMDDVMELIEPKQEGK